MIKTKNLHHIVINEYYIQSQIQYNINTNHIGVYVTCYRKGCRNKYLMNYRKNYPRINFLGKDIVTTLGKVKPGYVRHHISYDFKRPDALTVEIKRKLHSQIHNPKGIGLHKRGYSLID